MPKFHLKSQTGLPCRTRLGWSCRPSKRLKKLADNIAKQISLDVEDESMKNVVVRADDGKEIYKASIKYYCTISADCRKNKSLRSCRCS
jgi:hypothetical protein